MNAFRNGARLSNEARRELGFARGRAAAPALGPRRRAMNAKVHLAKKDLGLTEDDYRGILLEQTKCASLKVCTDAQVDKLLKYFEARGFKPMPSKGKRAADHPGAGKARALWISLGQLGAIENLSEQALEAFARRQLGCDRLQWADQGLTYKLIEALKAIAERHGWRQSLDGIDAAGAVLVLKRRLIDAQMTKLRSVDWVAAEWDAPRAAREFGGVEVRSILSASLTDLDQVAQVLGDEIAAAKAAGAFN